MIKHLTTAAVAVALVVGAAAPTMAASLTNDASFDAGYQLLRLNDKGVNAVAVYEDTADTMRATIVLDNGEQAFAYYDVDTLQQIGNKSEATRVLTKLDTGRAAPAWSINSLTHDDANFDD